MVDSAASKTFVKSSQGIEVTGESDKRVMAANEGSISATHTALLPTRALSKGARESYVVPEVKENLMSVPVLSDNGYTTIFLPDDEGVKIYKHNGVTIIENAPPVFQECRDERGLWYVPIADEHAAVPSSNCRQQKNWSDFCMLHWVLFQRRQHYLPLSGRDF
jgi:hypothetical protein